MPRGGARRGKPGASYPNRTDLNMAKGPLAPKAPTGLQYGANKALTDAQRAVPMAPAPGPAAPGGAASVDPMAGRREALAARMASAPGLLDPTQRPSEPVTSGIDLGPGPGSEALAPPPPPADTTMDVIRELYRLHPNEDLRELIEDSDSGAF